MARQKTPSRRIPASANLAAANRTLEAVFSRIFRSQSIYFYQLLGITLFLVVFGLVMVLSASEIDSFKATNNSFATFFKQAGIGLVGLAVMSIASLTSLNWLRSKARLGYLITMGLQLAVFFIGTKINGNKNWIRFAGMSFQPSEFLKIAMVIHVAAFLVLMRNQLDDSRIWWRAGIMFGAAMFLVIIGGDLGTVLIMLAMALGMLALAGLPTKLMRTIVLGLAVVIPVVMSFSASRIGRITAWLNPNAPDPNGYNWQAEHGMWALSAGRIFGVGLGESKMKWSWIPEVENDFIFAVIGEELGLVGALVVIALFVALAITFFKIWKRTADDFSRHVVAGIMMWIIFQAMVNIAVVLRLLPVLGVPLPLISAGGSSLFTTLLAIGLVLAVERNNHANPYRRIR